jgi:hypothetical protein
MIKDILQNEFQDQIGFHQHFHKNYSALVLDRSAGGSNIEADIYSWGVSDNQLINTVSHRIKNILYDTQSMKWPPHTEELENKEELDSNDLLLTFFT